MTISKTMMASLSVSKHHLNINEEQRYNADSEQNRCRSERASSLALPNSSLLDFYDKGQKQCNSVALLPINANVVVRRHSSHCYPMLEEKRQQQQQQQQQQQNQQEQQNNQHPTIQSLVKSKIFNPSIIQPNQGIQQQQQQNQNQINYNTYFNKINQHNQLIMSQQDVPSTAPQSSAAAETLVAYSTLSKATTTTMPPMPFKSAASLLGVNNDDNKVLRNSLAAVSSSNLGDDSIDSIVNVGDILMPTPATPPPPIPKRTFQGKYYGWGAKGVGSPTASVIHTPIQSQEQQQQQTQKSGFSRPLNVGVNTSTGVGIDIGSNAFMYPPAGVGNGCGSDAVISAYYPTTNDSSSCASIFVDIATPSRSLYSDGGLDAGGISDDDRMSLENSVFDESLTSTPVKIAGSNAGISAGTKLTNVTFAAAKTLAAALSTSELSNAAKRSNRLSSSTVDSAVTTSSSSSGYGSSGHSERFASTSTTADFRSRFSSVDTQSSLDGCLSEKTNSGSPLPKDAYKIERTATSDVILQDYNNSVNNNNDHHQPTTQFNNNNALERQQLNNSQKVPIVPQRKQYTMNNSQAKCAGQIQNNQSSSSIAQHNSQQSLNSSRQASSSVSASTSSSSTGSAGSETSQLSPSGSISTSATASNTAISPQTHNARTLVEQQQQQQNQLQQQQQQQQQKQQQKRPSVPPVPPARNNNIFETDGNSIRPIGAMRNKWNKQKPPPIVYPRLHQRQDSTLSNDSFSVSSSSGYNSKAPMDAPLLQNAACINKNDARGIPPTVRRQESNDSFGMTASRYGYTGAATSNGRNKFNYRQDSTISSDSFSQTSSPGYNSKIMEAPLLPSSLSVKRLCGVPAPIVCKQKLQNDIIEELEQQNVPLSPLTKCVSTPASLQTIVRFQNGTPNTMSLQHRIINRRKSSNPYVTNGRLKFRLFQVLLNAFALLAIAGGLAAYFNAYPRIKFVNKTIINTIHVENISSHGKNPAPGTCLPIIVKFCQGPQIPYNYTVFPNYIGHFGQLETQVDLDAYEALVDVRCYELVSLFLCTLFVPKCGSTGATVPPCKTLCTETMRRCGFFFDVFGLSLPEYLNCKLFKDFESAEDCVGLDQVRDVMIASTNPKCDGFQCDQNRCIPKDYVCDGHLDCMDQADEANCEHCAKDEIYCGENHCVGAKHICDGVVHCPYGQDERNCIRLSERNGDLGKGVLEVYRISSHEWSPACVKNWDRAVSPSVVCSMLGYNSVNGTSVITQKTHRPLLTSVNVSTDIWKMYAKKRSTLMQEFSNCKPDEDFPIAELTCSNYDCGKVKRERHKPSRRIIGGSQANPGSWPFLAAILGGPEKIFYCAGVLISDQWVLTASHCIGNHTVIDLEDWTIQLGVTRRNSFTYSGQKVKVKTVIPHPQYNTAIAHDNDIALFQLATRVAFHEHLLPVCLPPPSLRQLKPDQLCTVIGWGKREDKDPKSTYEPIVNEVQVPIIRRQICDEWLDNLTVSDGMICAGYEEGGKDACQGDSGGPLLCPFPGEKDRWFVGGIVSWGIMCAHPKLPGVYANVIKYVPWIREQMHRYTKPLFDEKISKYDVHPGGPDILSNMSPGPLKNKKPNHNMNRSPMDIDYYESLDDT